MWYSSVIESIGQLVTMKETGCASAIKINKLLQDQRKS